VLTSGVPWLTQRAASLHVTLKLEVAWPMRHGAGALKGPGGPLERSRPGPPGEAKQSWLLLLSLAASAMEPWRPPGHRDAGVPGVVPAWLAPCRARAGPSGRTG